jgi:hypothetical protein
MSSVVYEQPRTAKRCLKISVFVGWPSRMKLLGVIMIIYKDVYW